MSSSKENPIVLETYHQIRRSGEFPTPLTVSGAIISGILISRGCAAVSGDNVGLISVIPLAIAGGAFGYWLDRKQSRRRMEEFIAEHPQVETSPSDNS